MTTDISQEDVDAALSDIENLIEGIGDEQVDTVHGTVDDTGDPIKGPVAKHGDHPYRVIATPAMPFAKLQSGFNAAEAVVAGRVRTDGGAGSVHQPQNITPAAVEQASEELVEEHSDDELREIRAKIVELLAHDDMGVDLTIAGNAVIGFTVSADLFVYDKDLVRSEFASTAQTVINRQWSAKEYMTAAYDLEGAIEGDGDVGPSAFH